MSLIQGDLGKPNLGLSDGDRKLIVREVECIFHCAAASKLDENFLNATNVNVRGTKGLVEIAREIKDLKVSYY